MMPAKITGPVIILKIQFVNFDHVFRQFVFKLSTEGAVGYDSQDYKLIIRELLYHAVDPA